MEKGLNVPKMTAWLTINRSCNLRCRWCYARMTDFAKEDMSIDTVKKSLALFKGLGLTSVILLGGEPTIHPKFLEIVDVITGAGLKAYVVSNVVAFASKTFLGQAIDAGMKSITISFKAANRQDFLSYTGKDKFDSVMQGVRNIGESGLHHVVNVTVCEDLVDNFDKMVKTFRQTKASALSLDTGKPILHDGQIFEEGGSPKRMAKFFQKNYPLLKKSGITFSVKMAIPFCLMENDFLTEMVNDGHILAGCQMARGDGIIFDPQGELIPCNHLCNVSLGTLTNDFSTAEEYYNFRQRKEVMDFYGLAGSYPHQQCVDCLWWKFCGGGCKLYWMRYGSQELIGSFF